MLASLPTSVNARCCCSVNIGQFYKRYASKRVADFDIIVDIGGNRNMDDVFAAAGFVLDLSRNIIALSVGCDIAVVAIGEFEKLSRVEIGVSIGFTIMERSQILKGPTELRLCRF